MQLSFGGGGLNTPDGFTMEGGRGIYRAVGAVTLDEAVARVRAAIAAARSNQAADLLVDITALVGFPSPDTFQRFLAAVAWAEEAAGRLRLAMIARVEMIDRERFGVTVAANRGLKSNIFSTEADARAWLDAK
ncbi:MAG: hypothetical protein ACRERC_18120 [Candidatus Binatia bacterium]